MKDSVKQLRDIIHHIPLKRIVLPEQETLNEIFIKEGSAGLQNLMGQAADWEEVIEVDRAPLPVPLHEVIQKPQREVVPITPKANDEAMEEEQADERHTLEVIHENKILFATLNNNYFVLGSLSQDLSSMRITLMVEDNSTMRKERTKIDLYEREAVRMFAIQLAENFDQNPELIEAELLILTDQLENYRELQVEQAKPAYQSKRSHSLISPENQKACIEFLRKPDLIQQIDQLIEQAGVVGEESTRKLLFIISSTYKMGYPLHALVQGSSGSGKSHLINIIGQCLPPEDVLSMTRVTSKSFYHYGKDELVDKLLLIQDYDGLDEEAQYAFRELQSAGSVSSSTTYKDRNGNIMSMVKTVRSHFASLLATTKAEVYCDNMSRSVILGIDESEEQTTRIIDYQNKKLAGIIDGRDEHQAKVFLQNCMRCIKPHEVVNHYADKVRLPLEAKMLRRLNNHYQAFVKQITILHQYQRQKDDQGRLIAEPQDLQMACDILFDAIMLKVDDLDSSLRQFFDKMKALIKGLAQPKNNDYQFTQREVRLALNISKTQCFRFMEDLELLEYVQRTGGYANRGFKYKIVYWDDMMKIREKVKEELGQQLLLLKQAG